MGLLYQYAERFWSTENNFLFLFILKRVLLYMGGFFFFFFSRHLQALGKEQDGPMWSHLRQPYLCKSYNYQSSKCAARQELVSLQESCPASRTIADLQHHIIADIGAAGIFPGVPIIIVFSTPLEKRAIHTVLFSAAFGIASAVG